MDINDLLGGGIIASSLTDTQYYSKTENAFFSESLHEKLPSDCVEVPKEVYFDLLSKINLGYELQPDADGNPSAVKIEVPLDLIIQNIKLGVDNFITAQALSLGFLSFADVITYIGDIDEDKATKALALRNWRHTVWKFFSESVEPNINADTKIEDILPTLPKFEG